MAARNMPGFDPGEKVNSNTLKRHPKMDLSHNDLLQLLCYLEGELQARDVVIATLKAEKAKQLLYQAKYGRFGLGDPFSAMQRDSDNMKDNTFDESAIKSMYDNQLAQLENLIATQRKAQMKMREQMIAGEKKYQKVCSELDDEKRKHAQDTAQGDDVTYMLEKERERLKQEVDFEKANVKKMEKDMKKTLASLEEERAGSAKHKQVALMLIKERKKLVGKYMQEKYKADQTEKTLAEERNKAMNMAEGLVQESKKSLKMEATMERQASEFDLEREQLKNKLQREENRNKDLQSQIEALTKQLENLQKPKASSKDGTVHTVEIKSQVQPAPVRFTNEKSGAWTSSNAANMLYSKPVGNIVDREAGLSPRNTSADLSVRKRDNRYASPQTVSLDRGNVQYADNSNLEQRVAPVGAVADNNKVVLDQGQKLSVNIGGQNVVSPGGRISVQSNSPTSTSGQLSPRRMVNINRGTPPPIPPNKPVLPITTTSTAKPSSASTLSQKSATAKDAARPSGSKPIHIPVSVVHTTSVNASSGTHTPKHEGSPSPSSLRKPAQFPDDPTPPTDNLQHAPPTSESFDFLGQEMADLQQLLVSMVSVPSDSTGVSDTVLTTSLTSSISSTCDSSTVNIPSEGSGITSDTPNTSLESSTIATSSIPSTNSSESPGSESSSKTVISSSKKSPKSVEYESTRSEPSSSENALIVNKSSKSSEVEPTGSETISKTALTSSNKSLDSPLSDDIVTITVAKSSLSSPVPSIDTDSKVPVVSVTSRPESSNTVTVSSKVSINLASASNSSISLSESRTSKPLTSQIPSARSIPVATVSSIPSKTSLSQSLPNAISGNIFALTSKSPRTVSVRASMDSGLGIPIKVDHSQKPKDVAESPASPIHRYASMGNVEALCKLIVELEADVNLPMKDGTTPAHCAAENGHEECLRLLLDKLCNINSIRDDLQTPLHCAAANGHTGCVRYLLDQGVTVDVLDRSGWTPLHWAAYRGHTNCCLILLSYGARRIVGASTDWSSIHLAVHSNWPDCVDLLLTFDGSQLESLLHVKSAITQMQDKDEMTLVHLAAMKESPECLSVILQHCDIDVCRVDKWGRSALDVSSPNCRHLLQPYAISNKVQVLYVEIQCTGPCSSNRDSYIAGQINVHPRMHWSHLTSAIVSIIEDYFRQIDRGLRTKKVVRLDPEPMADEGQFSLGLSGASVTGFQLGNVTWTSVSQFPPVKIPVLISTLDKPTVKVFLKSSTANNDSLAFDLLLPLTLVDSVARQLDQYKSVIAYGPEGTRKKQLVRCLARQFADRERQYGQEPRISQVHLHTDFTHREFLQLLQAEGCLLPVSVDNTPSCILVLYGLEKVQLANMIGGLAEHIEHRGSHHSFYVPGGDGIRELCYFPDNFYLIATMDRSRSTGLDLSLQQRFRWVHFPIKNEPVKNQLGRHLLRSLVHTYEGTMPATEDPFFKVVEWVLCVWHRLNDGVTKLGLSDVVFGPDIFMKCPTETRNIHAVLDWLRELWNTIISAQVRTGVLKGTGKDGTVDGQHKVVNTALYVLMQRTIVPGCPLSGREKDDYLATLCGSNELDVPLKSDRYTISLSTSAQRRPLHNGHYGHTEGTNHRRSFGSPVTPQASHIIKRRSNSDTVTSQTDRSIEIPVVHTQSGDPTSDIQAKVPKLEIRSPVLGLTVPMPKSMSAGEITNRSNSFSTNNPGHCSSQRRSTFSSHTKIPQPASKRSRSSENLNAQQMILPNKGGNRATSPFSFSLTTPNSSLFSFKSYGKSGVGSVPVTNKSRSLTSSPTSLLYPSKR